MKTIFTLATGRSGTRFLSGILKRNIRGVVVRHEPYFDRWNPNLFGRPIHDNLVGDLESVRAEVRKKHEWVSSTDAEVYAETSHAFLKSWADVGMEFFPDMKLVHLVRDALKTARSEANREIQLRKFQIPFRRYRASDGRKYFRWSLTGREPIYEHFGPHELSLFQRYVVQWIEIENRAMRFLDRYGKHGDCFTIHSPKELDDPGRMGEMLRVLGVEQRYPQIVIGGHQNRTPGARTIITDDEERQFRFVIDRLPASELEIFARPPYSAWPWSQRLLK